MREKLYKKFSFPLMLIALGLSAEISYLSADQKVYENKCGRCHSLKEPDRYGKKEWKRNVERMAQRAGLTQEEISIIIKLNTK